MIYCDQLKLVLLARRRVSCGESSFNDGTDVTSCMNIECEFGITMHRSSGLA